MVKLIGNDDGRVQPSPLSNLKGGPEALRLYAGEVVAIADGEVKAHGATWAAAIAAADAAGLRDPLFHYLAQGALIGAHRT